MKLNRRIRLLLGWWEVTLAVLCALGLFVDLALLTYLLDLSSLGPLQRHYGPWGLPCLSEAACLPPLAPDPFRGCPDKTTNSSSAAMVSPIKLASTRPCLGDCARR